MGQKSAKKCQVLFEWPLTQSYRTDQPFTLSEKMSWHYKD